MDGKRWVKFCKENNFFEARAVQHFAAVRGTRHPS
jgi:hypothetical protein